MPLELETKMAQAIGATTSTILTSHVAMLAKAAEVAAVIIALTKKIKAD
jgi:hypothetical protein